jgi:hypothetical protein
VKQALLQTLFGIQKAVKSLNTISPAWRLGAIAAKCEEQIRSGSTIRLYERRELLTIRAERS